MQADFRQAESAQAGFRRACFLLAYFQEAVSDQACFQEYWGLVRARCHWGRSVQACSRQDLFH
ncbi:MAG: hypothetical protein K2L86_12630 [Lachnospiraceae bacterium]|nr:hypothetical protein [Lachnospiraceae bacterium]